MIKIAHILRKFSLLLLLFPIIAIGQELDEETQEELRASKEYLSDASINLQKEKFPLAEVEYRKAISLDEKSETGKFNLGTAYYDKNMNQDAQYRFAQAAAIATTKAEKHKAFHNLGNTYMNEKKYTEAVEAFKNALRNNPTDDETRYNFALAKEMLDKNPPPQPDEDGEDENEDKKDEEKENEDKQDKNEDGDNKDGDEKDDKKENEEGEKEDDKKDGEDEKDKGKPNEPKDKEEEGKQPQQQQPVPGKLSPQQVKSLLEAMNNEEKKVQDKVNAQKEKGAKTKTQKDW